jgi:hypothetical protein
VTAADLQVAERHSGDCEYVESLAEPPTSDDLSRHPDGEMEPVRSITADTLESIECQLGVLLADEGSSSSKVGNDQQVYALRRVALLDTLQPRPSLSVILVIVHKL